MQELLLERLELSVHLLVELLGHVVGVRLRSALLGGIAGLETLVPLLERLDVLLNAGEDHILLLEEVMSPQFQLMAFVMLMNTNVVEPLIHVCS